MEQQPSLFLNDSPVSKYISALVTFCGFKCSSQHALPPTVKEGEKIELPLLVGCANGEQVNGFSIADYVVAQTPDKLSLLGDTEQNKTLIKEWIQWCVELGDTSTGLDKKKHLSKLGKIHQSLINSVFLVNNQFSLADIAVYAIVAPLLKDFDERLVMSNSALCRWFDYIQHYDLRMSRIVTPTPLSFDLNAPLHPAPAGSSKKDNSKAGSSSKNVSTKKPTPASEGEGDKGKGKANTQNQTKGKKAKQAKGNTSSTTAVLPAISLLDIRVGIIKGVKKHPEADALYVEEIDLGEETPRTVVSGLVAFVPEDQMLNARVICLCNLKPAKMRGIMSHAMVLCAGNADHTKVELIHPPAEASVGEPVTFEGFERTPEKVLNPKKKIFESVKPNLLVSNDLIACYKDPSGKDIPFMTSAGPCKADSLSGGSIS